MKFSIFIIYLCLFISVCFALANPTEISPEYEKAEVETPEEIHERKQISKFKQYVRKQNNILKLKLLNGKEISFNEYTFEDYYKNVGFYFLINNELYKKFSLESVL